MAALVLTREQIGNYLHRIKQQQGFIKGSQKTVYSTTASADAILADFQQRTKWSTEDSKKIEEDVAKLIELYEEFPECFPKELIKENAEIFGLK
ncbi:hypothetical protein ACEPPN_018726 [Leptodophora sp. 'Broadleaf-Isolate-01']